ncbi:hypothetical protein LguiA_007948 [Lonicera macranthoides]
MINHALYHILKLLFYLSATLFILCLPSMVYIETILHFSRNFTKCRQNLLTNLALSMRGSITITAQIERVLKMVFIFLMPLFPCTTNLNNRVNLPYMLRTTTMIGVLGWANMPKICLKREVVSLGSNLVKINRIEIESIISVPDIEGSKEDRCELTRTPYGRRFINEELNSYLEFLFKIIAARCPNIGLNISLNRYDFFHGHIFLATDSGRLGILFHAKEYPAYDKEVFPYNMGYCQIGSNVTYDDSMNLRNILWLAPLPSNSTKDWLAPGVLVVLDARPGGIIFRDLIPDYVQVARTLYEDDFGDIVGDVNYLDVGGAAPNHQIFIC